MPFCLYTDSRTSPSRDFSIPFVLLGLSPIGTRTCRWQKRRCDEALSLASAIPWYVTIGQKFALLLRLGRGLQVCPLSGLQHMAR